MQIAIDCASFRCVLIVESYTPYSVGASGMYYRLRPEVKHYCTDVEGDVTFIGVTVGAEGSVLHGYRQRGLRQRLQRDYVCVVSVSA